MRRPQVQEIAQAVPDAENRGSWDGQSDCCLLKTNEAEQSGTGENVWWFRQCQLS